MPNRVRVRVAVGVGDSRTGTKLGDPVLARDDTWVVVQLDDAPQPGVFPLSRVVPIPDYDHPDRLWDVSLIRETNSVTGESNLSPIVRSLLPKAALRTSRIRVLVTTTGNPRLSGHQIHNFCLEVGLFANGWRIDEAQQVRVENVER